MMTDSAIIEQAREAWARIKNAERLAFEDWVAIGRACAIGRAESLRIAGTNKPFGKKFTAAMAAWLAENGLVGIRSQERYWALAIIDNLDAICAWRAGLHEKTRRRFNHPQAIWVNYQKSQGAARPTARRQQVTTGFARRSSSTGSRYRVVSFPSDMIQRGCDGLRQCRSSDLITLVLAVLRAALRDEADLETLQPKPKRPRLPAEAAAALA